MIKFPLWLNSLVECTVGGLMLFAPQTFHATLTPELLALSRTFGVAALAIGLITLRLALTDDSPAIRLGLWLVFGYHLGIAIIQILHPMQGMHPLVAPVFHGLLSLWGVGALVMMRRWY